MLRMRSDVQSQLDQVKAFADKVGASEELEKSLNYLATYACHERDDYTVCELYNDRAPYSFGFTMYKTVMKNDKKTSEVWFCGGLIYFGPGETGVSGPQYSVSMGGNTHRWEVHT